MTGKSWKKGNEVFTTSTTSDQTTSDGGPRLADGGRVTGSFARNSCPSLVLNVSTAALTNDEHNNIRKLDLKVKKNEVKSNSTESPSKEIKSPKILGEHVTRGVRI